MEYYLTLINRQSPVVSGFRAASSGKCLRINIPTRPSYLVEGKQEHIYKHSYSIYPKSPPDMS